MTISLDIPEATIRAVGYLFSIENALRELIIEELSIIAGPRWYKDRLPGDILKKYREGLAYERTIKWVQLIPHHPMYYVDFPHLRLTIIRKDNWNDAFKKCFSNVDAFDSTLSELEYLRNKVAHNRMISSFDLELLQGTYVKLGALLGEERFKSLSKRCTHQTDLKSKFASLLKEIDSTFQTCKTARVCAPLAVWPHVANEWWFDESYLGVPIEGITKYFELLSAYDTLPRPRGEGYVIEKWLHEMDIDSHYTNARTQAQSLA
jgi:hypothetical protein